MTMDSDKETALYTACGMYRHAYDRLAMVQQINRGDPNSPASKRLRKEALDDLVKMKTALQQALDDTKVQQ